jgi:hypothetical protein
VIILAVAPVQATFASQNMHCKSSSEHNALQVSVQKNQQHCIHATQNKCQCDLGNCHCAAASHFFLHSIISSFQFPLRHNLSVNAYLTHKTDVYISLTLRPPIAIFS